MWRTIYWKLIFAYIGFFLLALFVSGGGQSELNTVILSISTFTFAIILGFSISSRHSRLDGIRSRFRDGDALLLNIYIHGAEFGKTHQKNLRKLIDAFLMAQLDYKLRDFNKSTKYILDLHSYVRGLPTRKKIQALGQEAALDDLRDLLKSQKEVIYLLRDRMQMFEWFALIFLAVIIWVSLFFINDQSLFALITIPFLSTIIVLFLLILDELNKLRWQERRWIWEPLKELFLELDLLPYYPEPLLNTRRFLDRDFIGIKEYRVATYPRPYPNMKGKKVRVVKNT